MGLLRTIARVLSSRRFRGEVAGRVVDVRVGIWGEQSVIVDGAIVSKKAWAGFSGTVSHFFPLIDLQGVSHNAELRILDRSGGFMIALHVEMSLNGRVVARIEEVDTAHEAARCPRCGYSRQGLEPVNHELKCPECGRHTSMSLLK